MDVRQANIEKERKEYKIMVLKQNKSGMKTRKYCWNNKRPSLGLKFIHRPCGKLGDK